MRLGYKVEVVVKPALFGGARDRLGTRLMTPPALSLFGLFSLFSLFSLASDESGNRSVRSIRYVRSKTCITQKWVNIIIIEADHFDYIQIIQHSPCLNQLEASLTSLNILSIVWFAVPILCVQSANSVRLSFCSCHSIQSHILEVCMLEWHLIVP